jgi:hypothetical protein
MGDLGRLSQFESILHTKFSNVIEKIPFFEKEDQNYEIRPISASRTTHHHPLKTPE